MIILKDRVGFVGLLRGLQGSKEGLRELGGPQEPSFGGSWKSITGIWEVLLLSWKGLRKS